MLSQTLRSLSRLSNSSTSIRRLSVFQPTCSIYFAHAQASSSSTLKNTALHRHSKLNLIRCRTMSTPPPQVNESHLSVEEYHAIADRTMEHILETMEDLVESRGDAGQEVDYHSGVLTLHLGDHGTYVINKQPPNKQIWLSSPRSGPKRYDFQESTRTWVYSRDNSTLDGLLSEELSAVYDEPISFSLDD